MPKEERGRGMEEFEYVEQPQKAGQACTLKCSYTKCKHRSSLQHRQKCDPEVPYGAGVKHVALGVQYCVVLLEVEYNMVQVHPVYLDNGKVHACCSFVARPSTQGQCPTATATD
eukprot:1160859-Pelagomonas_calceolata.AAC.9